MEILEIPGLLSVMYQEKNVRSLIFLQAGSSRAEGRQLIRFISSSFVLVSINLFVCLNLFQCRAHLNLLQLSGLKTSWQTVSL